MQKERSFVKNSSPLVSCSFDWQSKPNGSFYTPPTQTSSIANRSHSILMKPTLLFTLLMLALVPALHGQQPPLPGGFSQAANTDAEVLKAAQFAVKAHDPKLTLKSVNAAEQQVVAGTNYKLRLTTSDGRKADAVVWRKLDGSHELTSWQWGAADPAILTTEYIYDTGPYPQIHATTIVETPTGLVTAWFGGTRNAIRMCASGCRVSFPMANGPKASKRRMAFKQTENGIRRGIRCYFSPRTRR
jgi:hypothetical protein